MRIYACRGSSQTRLVRAGKMPAIPNAGGTPALPKRFDLYLSLVKIVIPVRVECYSGYKGEERPVRFTLGARTFEIVEIDDRWYSPEAIYFRVKADDGNIYLLRHDEIQDRWWLEGFRYR